MSPLVAKLEALLLPDEQGHRPCPETAELIETAIAVEKGKYKCSQCGNTSLSGAEEEGDGGWWCHFCMRDWEIQHGLHWEDGTPIKP